MTTNLQNIFNNELLIKMCAIKPIVKPQQLQLILIPFPQTLHNYSHFK
jgi:hypothetical protein